MPAKSRKPSTPPLASPSSFPLAPAYAVLAMVGLAFLVYAPALTAGFIWDDGRAITNHPAFRPGHGLADIWTGQGDADYFPLKTTILWMIHQFFGNGTSAYHIFNVAVHATNGVILWRVLRRLAIPGAWLSALVFLVHPTHVESVAWVSECKNTLSLLFGLLAMLAWFDFEDSRRPRGYVLALLLFAAGLLCKTHVVVLPVVLVLCAWWRKHAATELKPTVKASRARLLVQVAPFFFMAGIFGAVTLWFQNTRAIAEYQLPVGALPSRVANAGKATWWYLSKAIWPSGPWYEMPDRPVETEPDALAVLAGTRPPNPAPAWPIGRLTFWPPTMIYPRWRVTPPVWYDWMPALAMLALFAWLARKRKGPGRGAFFALSYFLVALSPALGVIKMSYMRAAWVADHFQYLADIGVIAFLCALGARWARKLHPARRRPALGLAVAWVAIFSVWSFARAADYRSDYALWSDTVAKNPETWQGLNHLGFALLRSGEVQQAAEDFARAVRLKPDDSDGHNNYGLALSMLGRHDDAIEQFRASLRLKPAQFTAHANMGDSFAQLKKPAEAAAEYRTALQFEPTLAPLYFRLAMCLLDLGDVDGAIANLEKADVFAPNLPEVRNALAQARQKRAVIH